MVAALKRIVIHSQVWETVESSSDANNLWPGGSRYRPSGSSALATASAGDPFTGASRYQPSNTLSGREAQSSFDDPFTGSSRYQPSSSLSPPVRSSASPSTPFNHTIPHVCFLLNNQLCFKTNNLFS